MPEVRERKQGDKFKGKAGQPAAEKDMRQQMTAKFRKELVEAARNKNAAYTETPETEATDQVQDAALTTGREIKNYSGSTMSKVVSNGKERREKKKAARQRPEVTQGEVPTREARSASTPPPAQKRIGKKTTENVRNQPINTRQEQLSPKERPAVEAIRERPAQHGADRGELARPSTPPSQNRMRQTAVNDLRTKRTETSREQPALREQRPALFIYAGLRTRKKTGRSSSMSMRPSLTGLPGKRFRA